jgi:hypothetical protein
MGKHVAPEPFFVGETAVYFHGEDQWQVEVVAVNGEEVTVQISHGRQGVFAPRGDGNYVEKGSRETDVMPDLIFRMSPVSEVPAKKKSLWKLFG